MAVYLKFISYLCTQKCNVPYLLHNFDDMRKLILLIGLLPCLTSFGQGYKVYMSDGKVDAYPGETAVSVSLNDDSLRYNGHEYVDLGLPSGTRWATMNVGAGKGNPLGQHFTYELAKNERHWSGDWRLPGIPEYQELLRVCQWEWTKEGVCQGYRVTGPNGNSMFLPAAGFIKSDGSFDGGLTNQLAGYWTDEGYSLSFSASAKGLSTGGYALKLSLRPVIGGKAQPDVRSEVVKDGEHEYVDLGLSVLWATTNIGADTPEAYGDYFGLGCVEPTPIYSLTNDTYYDWLRSHSPYYPDGSYYTTGIYYEYYSQPGMEEELKKWSQESNLLYRNRYSNEMGYWLLPGHDAAKVLWGDGWRMPTLSEYKELIEKCSRKSGSNGYVFYGSNGNTLFLPAAGYYDELSFRQRNYSYLTSSVEDYRPLVVNPSESISNSIISYNSSTSSYPIRPVKDRPKAGLTDKATTAQQEMVDLGLSVLWANCNWGSASPQDKGEYAAFGETYPKAEYTGSNYHQSNGYTQQSTQTMFGKAGWTMPSEAEVHELINNCTWVREADGYRVTGPNGSSIFLPYTGFREGAVLNYPDELGLYRTLDGQALQFSADGNYAVTETNDYVGLAVRPVMNPVNPMIVETQTDWHSATITCKAQGSYKEFGIQLCYLEYMDNKTAKAWFVPSDSTSLQNGEYTARLNLQPNTPYYYRAYVITTDSIRPKTLYGDIKQLHTTADVPAVDLGLSVKWAPVNLGATHEYDLADWYTHPSDYYYGNGEQLPNIFNGCWYGSYLAPQTSWSDEWRMPTEAEFQELIDRCTWTWQEGGFANLQEEPNGWNRNGYKVTGPNGNSIFLPANGVGNGKNQPSSLGEIGYYWTQTPSEIHSGFYNLLKITASDKKITFGPTNFTYSIRPVKK